MINLKYILEKGNVWDEPHKTHLNRLDQLHFIENHKSIFKDKKIVDLGCGDAYIKNLKEKLDFNSYIGVDNNPESNADLKINFNGSEFIDFLEKEGPFDLFLSFNTAPEDFYPLSENLVNKGHIINQGTEFYFSKNKIEDKIKEYFKIKEKSEYQIDILKNSQKESELSSIFILAQKD